VINVFTGNKRNSGTNSAVRCILHCKNGEHSQLLNLDNKCTNDFKRGACDQFNVPRDDTFGMTRNSEVVQIELWREQGILELSPDWFVDRIDVINRNLNKTYVFPVLRWIENKKRYMLENLDTSLPMDDLHPKERAEELVEKRAEYMIDMPYSSDLDLGIVMSKKVPDAENWPLNYVGHLALAGIKSKLETSGLLPAGHEDDRWESMDELLETFGKSEFDVPTDSGNWNDDAHFGQMRLSGLNPLTIQLVTMKNSVPTNFPVNDKMLAPHMEKHTIAQAIEEKRLFLTDHSILEGIFVHGQEDKLSEQFVMCVPLALFYLDSKNNLKPVAIQLFQQPSKENPIFTPGMNKNLWTLAKMWYNNADTVYHQARAHLGGTHFVVEGIVIVTNRQLSLSHPVYKLLAPHFLYLIPLDDLAKGTLIGEDGVFDKILSCGYKGLLQLCDKNSKNWHLDTDGTLPEELKKRGVYDQDVLPNYHFRNDATLLWDAISTYVTDYVKLYYHDETLLKQDHELQNWAAELVREKNQFGGGLGMKGVPGDGEITHVTQLASIVTSVIYTASVAHAAANFPQYNQYAFVPNYPGKLHGAPPKTTDEVPDKAIMDCLPSKKETFDVWNVTKLLSEKSTDSLGFFEVQYVFDPAALKVLDRFRDQLKQIGETIEKRNKTRNVAYDALMPASVPNAISI